VILRPHIDARLGTGQGIKIPNFHDFHD
jgi:hypothetical protein